MDDEAKDMHFDDAQSFRFNVPIPEMLLNELSDAEIVDMVLPVVEDALLKALGELRDD